MKRALSRARQNVRRRCGAAKASPESNNHHMPGWIGITPEARPAQQQDLVSRETR
jgi:hypothetical protein